MNIKGTCYVNEQVSAIGLRHYICVADLDGNSELETIFNGKNHPCLRGKLYRITIIEDPQSDLGGVNLAMYENETDAEILRTFEIADGGSAYGASVFHYANDYQFDGKPIKLTAAFANVVTNCSFIITTIDPSAGRQSTTQTTPQTVSSGCCGRK